MAPCQVFSHSRFNRSPLVQFLAALEIAPVEYPRQTFAESLSQWVDWTDAISLSGAINGGPASGTPTLKAGDATGVQAANDDFKRVRAGLSEAIAKDWVLAVDTLASTPTTSSEKADFSPYRRKYLAHQKAMEARIAPLRARLRLALSKASPALGKLAALDAVLEQALLEREQQLLACVPGLLERHFGRTQTAAEAQADPVAEVGQTLQNVLLAELDIRLQPLLGMIEALDREHTRPS